MGGDETEQSLFGETGVGPVLAVFDVEVSPMVIDSIDGFADAPRRRSLLAADFEKRAELARKFRVAIVLAADVSPTVMPRSTRQQGMEGIDVISKAARPPPLWMIVRNVDVANGRMRYLIKKNRSMNPHGFAYGLYQRKIYGMTSRSGSRSKFFTGGNFNAAGTPGARTLI